MTGSIYSNFGKQPNIFLFREFLELLFTLANTPRKVKNSKLDKRSIFLGHPVVVGSSRDILLLILLPYTITNMASCDNSVCGHQRSSRPKDAVNFDDLHLVGKLSWTHFITTWWNILLLEYWK